MKENKDDLIFLPETFENPKLGYSVALLNKKYIWEKIKGFDLNANKKGLKILLQGYVPEDNQSEFIGAGVIDGEDWGDKNYILDKAPLLFGTYFTEWELDGDFSKEEIEDEDFDIYDEFLFRLADFDYEISSILIEGQNINFEIAEHENINYMTEEEYKSIQLENTLLKRIEDEEEME